MMIKRIFNKLFSKPKVQVSIWELYDQYIDKKDSTFLRNSTIRFDAKEKLQNRKYISIGEKGIITSSFIFESEQGSIKIGDNVHIGQATMICRTNIIIKNDVTMAWGVILYDHDSHSTNWEHRKNDNTQCYHDYVHHNGNNIANKDWTHVNSKSIIIEEKVWIGFDVLILKGVTIGEGAIVGAKSVVTKDVEPWTIVAGNPAVVVKYLPEYKK